MARRSLVAVGLAALMAVAVACGGEAVKESGATPTQDTGKTPAADMNILMVGMDAERGPDNIRPDTIVLVHVPKSGDSASLVSLPRDLAVEGGEGIGDTRLSSVYSLGYAAEKRKSPGLPQQQLAQKAQEDLVSVVQKVTDVTVDHYAQVDMRGFVQLSTMVGGVDVCLTHAQHDQFSGADFPAGSQKVQGDAALAFVRQRHGLPNGDLDRVKRQQAFLTGLIRTVAESGVLADPAKREALLGAVRKYVVLDQRWDLVSFADQVHALTAAGVRTGTIPTFGERGQTGGNTLVAEQRKVQEYVHNLFAPAVNGGGGGSPVSPPPTTGGDKPVCVN